ncbi:MAG: hypothetical protein ACFFG0_22630, partial [Candidatus Thorarchaeota archaeon]
MKEFDDFFENSFMPMVAITWDLIQVDEEIFTLILDAPIRDIDIREFYIRCWLAQKRLYFGW